MENMQIERNKILEIIKNSDANVNYDNIEVDSSLRKSGFDSLDMANVLLLVEENYGIKIPDEDIDNLDSINDIGEYLEQKLA
jgi:acyl carrier protein